MTAASCDYCSAAFSLVTLRPRSGWCPSASPRGASPRVAPTVRASTFPLPVSFHGCSSGTGMSRPAHVSLCGRVSVPLGSLRVPELQDGRLPNWPRCARGLQPGNSDRAQEGQLVSAPQGPGPGLDTGCPLVLLSEPRATVLSMWLVWLHSMPAKYEGAAPGRGVLSQRAFTTSRWKS